MDASTILLHFQETSNVNEQIEITFKQIEGQKLDFDCPTLLPTHHCPAFPLNRVWLRAVKVLTKAHPCGFRLLNNLQEFKRLL